jgi:hypothetical protein
MNKTQAHQLLDQRKNGFAIPLYIVNRALLVSGDISMACLPCQAIGLESTGMAQSQGTGVMPYGSVEWAKNGFSQQNERTQ